jgi:hypothetical protein
MVISPVTLLLQGVGIAQGYGVDSLGSILGSVKDCFTFQHRPDRPDRPDRLLGPLILL